MKTKHLPVALLALSLVATNLTAAPKDGDVVMTPKGAIYVIQNGKRCQLPAMEVFHASGFKGEDIIKVSDEELNAIPVGPVFTAAAKPQAQNVPAAHKEGAVIMSPAGSIFVIQNGKRCQIPSMEVFHASGLKRESVVKISDADLNAIPVGPVFKAVAKPQSSSASAAFKPYKTPKQHDIVQSPAGTIFVIRDGQRCQIPNMDIFNANGLKGEDIIKVSDEDLNAIPVGPRVE